MFVRDWMTRDPIVVSSDCLVVDAQKIMKDNNFRRLPIVDKDKLVGIVTLSNLREAAPSPATSLSIYELHYLLAKLKVKEVMTPNPITCAPDTPVEEAILIMYRKKIGAIPVVEKGKVVGIITVTDCFKMLVEAIGMSHAGVRYTIEGVSPDPGAIGDITRIIKEKKRSILSLVTMHLPESDKRVVVVRLKGEESAEMEKALEDAGYRVSGVHVMKP